MKSPPFFLSVLTASFALAFAVPLPAGPVTVLTGARLIDGTGHAPVENGTLVIEGERIVAIGKVDPAEYLAKGAKTISCDGQTIMPSLISDHSHLGLVKDGKVSPDNYTPENVEAALRRYEGYGVTAVLSLGANKDLLYSMREAQRSGSLGGADIYTADRGLGVASAGPPIPVGEDQVARPKTIQEARETVREMAARHPDLIKIWVDDFFGSEEPKMPSSMRAAIIDEAHRRGLRVAAHIFYLDDAKSLLIEGLDVVAHGVRDQPVDQRFLDLMKERHASYIATLSLDEAQFVYADQPAWMQSAAFRAAADPALLQTWLSPQYAEKMKVNPLTPKNQAALAMGMQNVKKVQDAGVLVGFGTDSGATPTRLPGWAEHRELQLLVQAGFTPAEAIVCATRHAAEVLGDLQHRGTLEAGKRADFLVLTANPLDDIANTTRLAAIYHGGKFIPPAFHEMPTAAPAQLPP